MTPNTQWFILKGENKEGPFEYTQIIQMIQNSEVYEYNYVWASHLESWTLIAELPEFSHDRMRNIIISNTPVKTVFKQRKHDRVDLELAIYAHNKERLFSGKTTSISLGGASFLINDPLIYPGNQIVIHFENNEKSFRVKAEVLRKSFINKRINAKSSLHYAVRFIDQPEGTDKII
ncbi:MAG TPA: PilZ domain-containing protein, partial [Pseudobdellovibrionaceae bacterium]|nr:PilZ domain-containing protein [Pseudobdellovibrionaceae bacterium]